MAVAANATPTKRFFVEMITRDISLEDAILDLIDNSIDSFIRTRGVELSAATLLETDLPVLRDKRGKPVLAAVTVELKADGFRIEDKTGGISRKKAQEEVFRFGAPGDRDHASLGVYGIGLKRAIFKLGRDIRITSRTVDEGFEIHLDAKTWQENPDDWTIPMEFIKQVISNESTFTVRFRTPPVRMTTKIQYDALNSDIDLIRKCLRKPRMSAKAIGEHTFQYFVEMECSE